MTRRTFSSLRFAGVALITCSVVLACWSASIAFRPLTPRTRLAAHVRGPSVPTQAAAPGERDLIDSIIAMNPFGEVEPGAERHASDAPPTPAPFSGSALPRLAAIAGPPWSAIVSFDGGALVVPVSVRDSVRGFRVVSIARDFVVLRCRDSTYRVALSSSRQ